MNYNELIQYYENFEKNDLAAAIRDLFFSIAKGVGQGTGDNEFGVQFATCVIANTIAQDGKLDNAEWALFDYILQEECPREDVINYLQHYHSDEIVTEIKKIAKGSPELGQDVIKLTLAVAAIDGKVSPEEHHLIKYLLDI